MSRHCPHCHAEQESPNDSTKCSRCGSELSPDAVCETIAHATAESANSPLDFYRARTSLSLTNPADNLSISAAQGINQRIEQFIAEWNAGREPDIAARLVGVTAGRLEFLNELVHADLEHRLRAGQAIQVESYWARFPALAASADCAVEFIVSEFRLRRKLGEQVRIADFVQRFPKHRAALEPLLAGPLAARPRRFPIRVSCPHCKNPIALVNGEPSNDVECPSCHESFRIDPDRTQTWSEEKLPKIGRYQLLRPIGKGAFGTVYSARDTELDRLVAIKLPRSGTFANRADEDAFLREARAAAQIHHRHIVEVYDCGHTGELPYIVSELVHGSTLADLLQNRGYTYREAAELIATVATAIQHAHDKRIVHRDLKPGNLMIDASGEPRIMDFGLARRERPGEVTMTVDGHILGTPAYMSPEQARGDSHLADARSDVYSLGVILFELLTGRRPFKGKSAALIVAVATMDPWSPRVFDPRVPRDLETIALKCLQRNAEQRYQSARELAEDLRRYLRNEPILARPIPWWERAARWCQRNREVAAAAAIVFATLIAALGTVSIFWRGEHQAKLVAKGLAEDNRKLFEQEQVAKRAAQKSRDQALRRLGDARHAVDRSVDGVSDALRWFPGLEDFHRDMLQKAAEDYANFARDNADIPELELERARALMRLAEVRRAMGEGDEAERTMRAAIAALEALAAKVPTRAETVLALAKARTQLGLLLVALGRVDAARVPYAAAGQALQSLPADAKTDDELADGLATWRVNTATLALQVGNAEQALATAREAVRAFGELADRNPRQPRFRLSRSTAESVLAQILLNLGQLEESAATFRNAIVTLDGLVQLAPENVDYLAARAEGKVQLAAAWQQQGKVADELLALQQAAGDFELLTVTRPGIPRYQDDLALTWTDVGIVRHLLGDARGAVENLRKAESLCAKLTREYPAEATFLEHRAACWQALGNALSDRNERDAATSLLEQAVRDYDRLHAEFPLVPAYAERAAVAATHLGRRLHERGEHMASELQFKKAIATLDSLSADAAVNPATGNFAAHAHYRFALLLREIDRSEDARRHLDEANRLWSALTAGDDAAPEQLAEFAQVLIECPDATVRDGKRALKLATHASRVTPSNPFYASLVGHARVRLEEWEPAIQALDQAAALHGEPPIRDGFFRAIVLAALGKSVEAKAALDRTSMRMRDEQPGNRDLQRLQSEAAASVARRSVPSP